MNALLHEAAPGLVVSGLSVLVWSILFGRTLALASRHVFLYGLHGIGILVSLAFFANAFGYAQDTHLIAPTIISTNMLFAVGFIGQLGLLIGGLVLLFTDPTRIDA